MFCCTLLYVHFSIAIILMGKRELIALLNLSSWCLVMVERLFLTVPRGCLQFVIVVFPDHTHLLFFKIKFHVFCETRWVEKHTTVQDSNQMFEPVLECLKAIGGLETVWQTEAVTDADGLLMKITESNFIMCFQTVLHMFG